ncbi:uncharacterized protein LOC128233723 [Mya arenaria]|uniref:uncharacterized protein LOC128233715 n=1 Tax=Mya arenaria TaxID=6604 RepID=UPI0022E82313|nr:uncharacterized protein LOC128233715 [Mya arenaria]XP_052803499.1 uncharacterized protein LOC128233723 [Mya arenaria]
MVVTWSAWCIHPCIVIVFLCLMPVHGFVVGTTPSQAAFGLANAEVNMALYQKCKGICVNGLPCPPECMNVLNVWSLRPGPVDETVAAPKPDTYTQTHKPTGTNSMKNYTHGHYSASLDIEKANDNSSTPITLKPAQVVSHGALETALHTSSSHQIGSATGSQSQIAHNMSVIHGEGFHKGQVIGRRSNMRFRD